MLPYRHPPISFPATDEADEMASILNAVARGEIKLQMIMPHSGKPDAPEEGPAVVVIGDDPNGSSVGPKAFHADVVDHIRAADMISVYSGRGGRAMYEQFARVVTKRRLRAVIIQTQVKHHEAWMAVVNREASDVPVLEIHPTKGVSAPPQTMPPGMSRQQRRWAERKGR